MAIINNLDKKYYNMFLEAKFPSLKDAKGNILPKKYSKKFIDKEYVLKYSRFDNKGSGQNYYLLENESLFDFDNIVRINYIANKITPQEALNMIIDEHKIYEGYKVLTNKKSGNSIIFSHITYVLPLGSKKSIHNQYIRYSIIKLTKYKNGIKAIEFSYDIPQDDNTDKVVKELNLKHIEYLQNIKTPSLIKENMGVLLKPMDIGKAYYYKGIKR